MSWALNVNDFRDLKIWSKSHQLTLDIDRVTSSFPEDEFYGLTSEIRRASSSIPACIAEGFERGYDAHLARLLRMAMSSASDLEYCLLLARILGILPEDHEEILSEKLTEVKRLLTAYLRKLRSEPINLKLTVPAR